LRAEDIMRLNIDIDSSQKNASLIKNAVDLIDKIVDTFSIKPDFEPVTDPDLMIYSGGFFNPHDKALIEEIRCLNPKQLTQYQVDSKDTRLPEMFFRYKARNYPESLSKSERDKWIEFCISRLAGDSGNGFIGFSEYESKLSELKQQANYDVTLHDDLEAYAWSLKNKLQLG